MKKNNIRQFEGVDNLNVHRTVSYATMKINLRSPLAYYIDFMLKRGAELDETLREIKTGWAMIPYEDPITKDSYIYGCSGFSYKSKFPSFGFIEEVWAYVNFKGFIPKPDTGETRLLDLWDEVVKKRVSFKDIQDEIGLKREDISIDEMFYYIDNTCMLGNNIYLKFKTEDESLLNGLESVHEDMKAASLSDYSYAREASTENLYRLKDYQRPIFINKSTPQSLFRLLKER